MTHEILVEGSNPRYQLEKSPDDRKKWLMEELAKAANFCIVRATFSDGREF